jgi:FAD/FMN-containing dehydrogenase
MNTGGYSPFFSRSFGLFIDYVQSFDIVTADGELRTICPPDTENPNLDNDDLWFCVLGGSPGNFGIVLRMKVRVLHDDHFPHSRGIFQFLPFTKECLQAMLELVEENNDDPDIPAAYALSVIAISKGGKHPHELDQEMREKYPILYGEKNTMSS